VGLAAGLSLAALTLLQCGGKKSTDITINDAVSDTDGNVLHLHTLPQAAWVELDVFPNACPSDDVLATGAAPGASQSFVVPTGQGLPAVGDLSSGSYGFAVLVRDASCGVIGFGCKTADVSSSRSVSITVHPQAGATLTDFKPMGACMAPLTCSAGVCAPGGDGGVAGSGGGGTGGAGGASGSGGSGTGGSSGSAGKGGSGGSGPSMGCKLDLVKSGELPSPIEIGATVAGPAVVATPTGFLIGYRDLAVNGSMDRVTVIAVGADGSAAQPSTFSLGACPGSAVDVGVAMAVTDDGSSGLLAAARPACKNTMADGGVDGAGITFVRFTGGGQISDGLLLKGPDGFPAITLGSPHALVRAFSPFDYRVTYVQSSTAFTFPIVGVMAAPNQPFDPVFTPLQGTTAATSASSADLLLQAGTVAIDGGTQTAVRIEPKGSAAKTVFRDPAAAYAAVAFGQKAALVSRDAMGNLGWVILGSDAMSTGSGTVMGAAKGFDAAVINDRLVVASGQNLGFTLTAFKGVSGTPATTADVTATVKSDQVSQLASFDGAQLAAAASQASGRVLVAWASRNQLGAKDPTGGYAVFRCEP
jgi:hypothetical protein